MVFIFCPPSLTRSSTPPRILTRICISLQASKGSPKPWAAGERAEPSGWHERRQRRLGQVSGQLLLPRLRLAILPGAFETLSERVILESRMSGVGVTVLTATFPEAMLSMWHRPHEPGESCFSARCLYSRKRHRIVFSRSAYPVTARARALMSNAQEDWPTADDRTVCGFL